MSKKKKLEKLTFKLAHTRGEYPVMAHLLLHPDGSVTWTKSQEKDED